jgi:hypothetical protein
MSRTLALLCLCAAPLLAIGCSKEPLPQFGQVQGVLTAKGKPLKGMIVTFMPEPAGGVEFSINGSGTSDESGHYELQYGYKELKGAGAPVGMNRVVVHDTRYASIPQGANVPPRLFSNKYESPTSTPLKFEVKLGPQTIDLKLD